MNFRTAEQIRRQFESHSKDNNRLRQLIANLTMRTWKSSTEKNLLLGGLEKLDRKEGKPHGLHDMHNDLRESEAFLFECFERSIRKTLDLLLKSKKIPVGFKVLVIEEYLKFSIVNIREVSVEGREKPFKFHYIPYLHNMGPLFYLPKLIESKTAIEIFDRLNKIKNKLFEEFPNMDSYWDPLRVTDSMVIKTILLDPFFRKEFKYLIKNVLIEKTFRLNGKKKEAVQAIKIQDFKELRKRKFWFDSKSPNNKPYNQYRKNLFFTYFFILHVDSELNRSPISLRFDANTLNLTIELNEKFYESYVDPEDGLPFRLTIESLKSSIKDFYNQCCK